MIAKNFDEAFELVKQLASTFSLGEKHYLAPGYSESQVRKDFIDKFWMALGWDVDHIEEKNPYQQRVKVEHSQKEGASRKRADYAFLAGNFRDVRFFVEAKKPAFDIDNSNDYFQTIRYGWNAQTPLAVLTDFRHFRVLDCRHKPEVDSALQRVVRKFSYDDYADEAKFREIYYLFSFEAVTSGSLENFVVNHLPSPSGKAIRRGLYSGGWQSVDEAFLQELDSYREELVRAFKNKNPQLDSGALTEVTQRTLDRLVFMRFLEDKLIEPEPIVEKLGEKGSAWQDFIAASRRLDKIYNGIIFKKHSLLDSTGFQTDNQVFEGIREKLAHINSPYDFNAIPIHILGSIYERFLGKTIIATDKRARVEEKPEVRKAGGVYYTPEYIVRYIVAQTVGKLMEGKTPEEIREMRFADVACGSGSFLLSIYDLLLRHHTDYYNKNKTNREKGRKAGCIPYEDGQLRLSIKQKGSILLNNIYGVDIDAQAVEVAQLSLYLKLLEDETPASARHYQLEFREALLPSLNENIVCGNSLIGWDVENGNLFGGDYRHLNPMDFKEVFKTVINRGGFDAIVGNPPYIRIQTMQETVPDTLAYYKKRYAAAGKGNYDIYVVFVERALSLLSERGKLGYILPHKFFNAQYGEPLRKLIAAGRHLSQIVHFGDQQVFTGATTYTCLLFLNKEPSEGCRFIKVSDLASWRETDAGREGIVLNSEVSGGEWNFSAGNGVALFDKLSRMPGKLEDIAERMAQGIRTSANEIYVLDVTSGGKNLITAFSRQLGREVTLERAAVSLFLQGREIKPFQILPSGKVVIIPYRVGRQGAAFIEESEMQKKFPKTYAYLLENKTYLQNREKGKMRGTNWYGYVYPKNIEVMQTIKILVPDIADRASFALDEAGDYAFTSGYGITLKSEVAESPKYFLGLLNSKLLDFYLKRVSTTLRGGFFRYFTQFTKQLPIRRINFDDRADSEHHDRMVRMVERLIETKKAPAAAKTEQEQRIQQGRSGYLSRQIDQLVYELYRLTPAEIAIIEAG